jgi:hypothetical protein
MESRAKLVSLAALMALSSSLATGCAIRGASLLPNPSLPNPHPADVFLLDGRSLEVGREYVDRYACRSGEPLQCQCTSLRISSACDCACY